MIIHNDSFRQEFFLFKRKTSIIIDMTKRPNVKVIYVEVPAQEYYVFKKYALLNDISLQKFIRSAATYWIKESEKGKLRQSKEGPL